LKLLQDILYRVRIQEVVGSTNAAVEHITMDSRNIRPFSLFVAVKGTRNDGHQYIHQTIEAGATAIICEQLPEDKISGIAYIKVYNSQEALGIIACNFYDNPSSKIKIVAVTGTNGKTTTATLMHALARRMNIKAGLISTVVNKINDAPQTATHTTPDALSLNALLSQMVESGCKYCFMEASSHALHQHRLTGTQIEGALFTNITHDHLDYHGSFNEYIKAKKILFDALPTSAFAIVNNDDRHAEVMLQNCKCRKKTMALQSMADYKAKVIESGINGLHLGIEHYDLYSPLIGHFNEYNLLSVYAAFCELGFDKTEILTELSALHAPEGRFQYIRNTNQITAIVDYAHTPDALENVLTTITSFRGGNEALITVVGCGGDRDKTKRPEMARIAAKMSNRLILTSDNPRSEKPEDILIDMKSGLDPVSLKKTLTITDRREAIALAVSLAQQGDIILIAGKGHEKYQEIAGVRYDFDDFEIVSEILKEQRV